MKLKYLFLPVVAVTLMVISSCQKNKEDTKNDPAQATLQKILGKWQIETMTTNQQFGGTERKESHPGGPDDYVDFKPDGKMYTFFQNKTKVSSYRVESSTRIVIDGDGTTIRQLTEHSLVLYSRDETGSVGFVEVIYKLKR